MLAVRDRGELDQIRQEYRAELRRLQEAAKSAAVERSSNQGARLRSTVDTWRENIESLNFNYVVLDEPGLILPVGDASVTSAVAPWNNVAQVSSVWPPSFSGDTRLTAGVEFVFAWRNPNDTAVAVNVESVLQLDGFCTVAAGGGFLALSHTEMAVSAGLGIHIDPGTTPPFQISQLTYAGDLIADGGGWFGIGEVVSQEITGVYDVAYRTLAVRGGAVAVFTVVMLCDLEAVGDGFGEADFASGDFQAMCPALVMAIL